MKRARSGQLLPDTTRATVAATAIIIAVLVFVYLIRAILIPFVFAGILAYVCTPLVDRLARGTGGPRWLLALIVVLVLLAIAVVFLYLAVPPLVKSVVGIGGDLQDTVKHLLEVFFGGRSLHLFGQQVSAAKAAVIVVGALHSWFAQNEHVLGLAEGGFAGAFGFILSWVLFAYLLVGARQISDGLFWLVPPRHRSFARRVWRDLNPILRRYFVGIVLVVLYASAAAYLGLGVVLGLQHSFVLAIITGLLEAVPLFGPAASGILGGLVAVQEDKGSWLVSGYIGYVIVLRISIDEFFGPIVLGQAAYVQPALVIFCFLAGAILFGIVGIVLALPAALTIKATLAELYREPEAMLE
jgi:predicted PurR-regulated permease PerM